MSDNAETDGKTTGSRFDGFTISPEAGGMNTTDLPGGKGAATLPSGGQSVDAAGKDQGGQAPSDKGQELDRRKAMKEELLSGLNPVRTPEEELEIVRKEHAASSRASRKNNETVKAIEALAKEQGLKLDIQWTTNEQNEEVPVVNLIPTKEYSKTADFKVSFKDLSDEDKELYANDPPKFIEGLLERARKAFVRVAPTAEKVVPKASDERVDAVIDQLSKRHPTIVANKELIKEAIARGTLKKSLVDAFNDDPATMSELLHLKFEDQYARAIKRSADEEAERAKKEEEKQRKAQTMPTGNEGAMTLGTGSSRFTGFEA